MTGMTVEVLKDGQWVPLGWHAGVILNSEPAEAGTLRLGPWKASGTVRVDTWPMELQLMLIAMRLQLLAHLVSVVGTSTARLGLDRGSGQ